MKLVLILMLALIAGPVLAVDLGPAPPAKPVRTHIPPPVEPEILRQGGDTLAEAVEVNIPYMGTGTTVGYTDDYDEECPYTQSTSPDVVYTFTPWESLTVDIDMVGSAYDTKIYLYDAELNLLACNDDFYPDYVSKLEAVYLEGGLQHYLVIDGYGGDAGEYQLEIVPMIGDVVTCMYGSVLEDEPPLENGYIDLYNGGCNSLEHTTDPPFQPIVSELFCGQGGWYMYEDSIHRDTDWFTLTMPISGELVITADATWASYMFELTPHDCQQVAVAQLVEIGPFSEGTMIIQGDPGSTVWLWVGAQSFDPPGGSVPLEYTYMLWIPGIVATEERSWSAVKGLFD